MGANQSGEETQEESAQGTAAHSGEMKTDFYVLLGVERTADQDEFVGPHFFCYTPNKHWHKILSFPLLCLFYKMDTICMLIPLALKQNKKSIQEKSS